MGKLLLNCPILEEDAVKLFREKTTRRDRDKEIVLEVVKLQTMYTKRYDFYWVQIINSRPQLDLVLKVMSGKGFEGQGISEGDFYDSFEEKHLLTLKRTEKISEGIYFIKKASQIKFLEVPDAKKACEILEVDNVYLANVQARKGKYAFTVWVAEDSIDNIYKTISIWGHKQTFNNPDFVNRVDIGDKVYSKTFTVDINQNGLCLL